MKKISINTKLIVLGLLLVLVPSLIMGIVGYNAAKKAVYAGVEERLKEQASQISSDVQIVYNLAGDQLKSDLSLAHEIFYSYGSPYINDEGKMVLEKDGKKFVVNDNFEIVDKIKQEMKGGTSTIFMLKDYTGDPQNISWPYQKAMYRISTNVLKTDGSRAVGTILSQKVYDVIITGKPYYGRAWVVNAWYISGYEPIFNEHNNIIGVLYVGIKEEQFQEAIKANLAKQVVGKSGYMWILDYNGTYILSKGRQRDGENIWNAKDSDGRLFVQELVNKGKALEVGQNDYLYYPWKNAGETEERMKISGISHFKDWNWVIGSSAYLDDFGNQGPLRLVRNTLIAVSIICVLLGIVLVYLVANQISKPIKSLTATANKINDGDFDAKVEVTSNDEVGDLAAAMEGLVMGIKNLKQQKPSSEEKKVEQDKGDKK